MKEILVSGNPTKDFERLCITPKLTYGDEDIKDTEYKVYELTEEDFKILRDELDDIEGTWDDCGWRYCESSNQGNINAILKVNGNKMKCWVDEEDNDSFCAEYDNLLEYLYDVMGASTFKNICALTMDLAKYNNMKLSELFKNYQD